jgi:hypothetical protein
MRIRINPFTKMQIPGSNFSLNADPDPATHQSDAECASTITCLQTDPPGHHFEPPRLHCERPRLSKAPLWASKALELWLQCGFASRSSFSKIMRIYGDPDNNADLSGSGSATLIMGAHLQDSLKGRMMSTLGLTRPWSLQLSSASPEQASNH